MKRHAECDAAVEALEKTAMCADRHNLQYVAASKVRDPVTGKITGTTIDLEGVNLEDKRLLIVICDGGRTFTELAKVIKSKVDNPIDLYVTHGIFSKGLNVFDERIYCPNSWFEDSRITTL